MQPFQSHDITVVSRILRERRNCNGWNCKENYKANEPEKTERDGRKNVPFFCRTEEKIIMGKNFHMEGRYHLHLSETAVRILLPRHLVDRPMVSDSCSEHDPWPSHQQPWLPRLFEGPEEENIQKWDRILKRMEFLFREANEDTCRKRIRMRKNMI